MDSRLVTLAAFVVMAVAGSKAQGAIVTIERTLTDYEIVRRSRPNFVSDEIRETLDSPNLPPISGGDTVHVNITFATPLQIVPDDISTLWFWVSVGDLGMAAMVPPGDATFELEQVRNLQVGPWTASLEGGLDYLDATRRMSPFYSTNDLSTLLVDPANPGTFGELKFEFVAPSTTLPNYVFSTLHVAVGAEANGLVAGPMLRADPTLQVIPEPSTFVIWGLLSLSFVGIGSYRRRKAA